MEFFLANEAGYGAAVGTLHLVPRGPAPREIGVTSLGTTINALSFPRGQLFFFVEKPLDEVFWQRLKDLAVGEDVFVAATGQELVLVGDKPFEFGDQAFVA